MTARTRAELATQISSLLADNDSGDISEADVRSVFTDVVDSLSAGNINIDASGFTGNLATSDTTLQLSGQCTRPTHPGRRRHNRGQSPRANQRLRASPYFRGWSQTGRYPTPSCGMLRLTAAAIRTLLGLTSAEVDDLFTGATIAGQVLTFTQNDGTTVAITIPTAMAGSGDGVVQSGAISGTDLVLTLDTGGTITIDIDALATDIELGAYAALTGATFTGAVVGIDPTADQEFVTKAYADANYAGSVPAPMHDLIVGWSVDTSISDAELTGGAMSSTDSLTIPDETGAHYMFAWRADDDGGDFTEVHWGGGGNQRNVYGAAVARAVDSIAGQLIITVGAQTAEALSGLVFRGV